MIDISRERLDSIAGQLIDAGAVRANVRVNPEANLVVITAECVLKSEAIVSLSSTLTEEEVEDASLESVLRRVEEDFVGAIFKAGARPRKPRKPKRTDDLTWWQHCKRWSVQLYIAIAGFGLIDILPSVLAWISGNKPLWGPLLGEDHARWVMVAAGLLGVVIRKLRQEDD